MAFSLNQSSSSGIRLETGGSKRRSLHLGGGTYQPVADEDNRTMRWAAAVAVLFHLGLFLVTFPSLNAQPREISGSSRPVYVVQQVRFQPPQPKKAERVPPTKKTRKIPIPDPTPDEPEPIVDENIDAPEIDISQDVGDFSDIPTGPVSSGPAPMWLDGNINPPEKIYAPQPRYTEEARKSRIQGVVILQAIIDSAGKVTRVKVLKGLPEGLADSAVETVEQWQFKPATLDGEPVPVYLNLTVSFSLQ